MSIRVSDILATLQSCPGMTSEGLAQSLGAPHDQVRPRLYLLRKQGYVEKEGIFWRLTKGDAVRPASKQTERPRAEVTFEGQTRTVQELSEIVGTPYKTLYARIHYLGWSVEDAVSVSVKRRRRKRAR